MDRVGIAELEADRVANALEDSEHGDRWRRLVDLAGGGDAADLVRLVCRLDPPERIAELRGLETAQNKRGAGFLGVLPDQIPSNLPTRSDLGASLDLSVRLAQIRVENLKALSETMPQYPLTFHGEPFDPDPVGEAPVGWRLAVDVAGIRAVLDFLEEGTADVEAASTIARMPAFVEMMRHRTDLGYVPEPLIDADGFAWCLVHAASRDPVDALWRWLHPQNLFDLSDLFAHRDAYRCLIDRLVEDDRLATYVLGSIAPYAPPDVGFDNRLSFAVGWGIRGWATRATGGVNIEHTKDDFDRLLSTLVHETFHRLQTSIALADPSVADAGFDRITSFLLASEADRRLYRALAYVMLEGSATYVAASEPAGTWRQDMGSGLDLLERIRALDASAEADAYDTLLNEGLRSNGPFYGFGALLSRAIVDAEGPSGLGLALRRGAPFFVERGLGLVNEPTSMRSRRLDEHIERLRAQVAGAGNAGKTG